MSIGGNISGGGRGGVRMAVRYEKAAGGSAMTDISGGS